ncbi:phage head closure protein [Amorphus sp. 3PC139-8]|uniref:phage head closure protein n=1 Tax=Amorphus sp. 3PC139-8 TaxID=2735676 RepID=UPI00345D0CD4
MTGAPAIGALDRRLTIETPTATSDGAGGETVVWTKLADVWGRVDALSAAERDRSGRLDGVATHRVTIRARTGVTGGQRLKVDGRTLMILATRPVGVRDRFLLIEAEEEGR